MCDVTGERGSGSSSSVNPVCVAADELIDIVDGQRVYLRALYCYNKCDLVSIEECDRLAHQPNCLVARCVLRAEAKSSTETLDGRETVDERAYQKSSTETLDGR